MSRRFRSGSLNSNNLLQSTPISLPTGQGCIFSEDLRRGNLTPVNLTSCIKLQNEKWHANIYLEMNTRRHARCQYRSYITALFIVFPFAFIYWHRIRNEFDLSLVWSISRFLFLPSRHHNKKARPHHIQAQLPIICINSYGVHSLSFDCEEPL